MLDLKQESSVKTKNRHGLFLAIGTVVVVAVVHRRRRRDKN